MLFEVIHLNIAIRSRMARLTSWALEPAERTVQRLLTDLEQKNRENNVVSLIIHEANQKQERNHTLSLGSPVPTSLASALRRLMISKSCAPCTDGIDSGGNT